MGKVETLAPMPGRAPGKLLEILSALSPADRRELRSAILSDDATAEWISLSLSAAGYELSASSVRTYRRQLAGLESIGAV